MQITLSPLATLLGAVIAQALFAAGLLWLERKNRLANRILACLMAAIALWLCDAFFRVSGIYSQRAGWYFSPIYYSFAFGPLIWLYVQSLTNSRFRLQRGHLWHFVPVALQGGLYGWLRLQPYATRLWFWDNVHRPYTYRVEFLGTWISLTLYLAVSLVLLRRYAHWLPEHFSETSRLRLRWLWVLLGALVLVSAQWGVEVVLREYYDIYYQYDYSSELLGVLVFVIGVAGLRQASMAEVQFSSKEAVDMPLIAAQPTHETPPPEADPALVERIRQALETEGLFRNPTLSLNELAVHLRLPPRLVSQTINRGFGKSFSDVVNGYRVAEVQRRLARPAEVAHLTLLGIAYESGFNSKTTFNRIFKEVAGVSPREFTT